MRDGCNACYLSSITQLHPMNPHAKKLLHVLAWGLILFVIPFLFAFWLICTFLIMVTLEVIVRMHPGLRSKVDKIVNDVFFDISLLKPLKDGESFWDN